MSQEVKTAKITVGNEIFTVPVGTRLSDAIGIPKICGGHGKCGKCKIKALGALSPFSYEENKHLTAEEIAKGIRLACRTYVHGDCRAERLDNQESQISIVSESRGAIRLGVPAFKEYGVAIDVGTTTLAARLYNAAGEQIAEDGIKNPQSAYGADVISRLEAALGGKADKLADSIRQAINKLIYSLSFGAGIQSRLIDGAVITGNTAMLTLLTESDPTPLTRAPFDTEELFGKVLSAASLGISSLSDDTKIYLPPCISAFVGADMTCAILASGLTDSPSPSLIADVGTNGEMGLWKDGELWVCSTAAGPAFEGASIKMGMNGAAGAVDRVTLINGRLSAHVIGNSKAVGICGSGLVDAIACLLDTEEMDTTGLLESDPTVVAATVVLTQEDIRMVQLAKSAIYAGIVTLLDASGTSAADVDRFYVAGGFGSRLNIHNAARIGLIPQALAPQAQAIGNAALHGAAMLLLDTALRDTAADIARSATVTDLATNPVFADSYINGILF